MNYIGAQNKQHRAGIYLRETEKFLVLLFEGVKTMKEAEGKVEELLNFVPK